MTGLGWGITLGVGEIGFGGGGSIAEFEGQSWLAEVLWSCCAWALGILLLLIQFRE